MIQFLSEIARYQFLLLRVTRQTAAECFKFEKEVTADERFFFLRPVVIYLEFQSQHVLIVKPVLGPQRQLLY